MPTLYVVRAFVSDDQMGGYLAGVVLNAEDIGLNDMQKIAVLADLPEVAFVRKGQTADYRVHCFTPTGPEHNSTHAALAAFYVMRESKALKKDDATFEFADGSVQNVSYEDGKVYLRQKSPEFESLDYETENMVFATMGLAEDDVMGELKPMIVNTGVRCLVIPVKDEFTLQSIRPDMESIYKLGQYLGVEDYFPFTVRPQMHWASVSARSISPSHHVGEPFANMNDAGALGCYLQAHASDNLGEIVIAQGHMGPNPSPSCLRVFPDGCSLSVQGGVSVGGDVLMVEERKITV